MTFRRSRQSQPEVRQWRAPRLNRRIILTNDPAELPDNLADVDDQVWAARRDIQAEVATNEGSVTRELRTLFTIRYRDGVASNVTVIDGAEVFQSTGIPQKRGGEGRYGSVWLVIETVQRE